MIERIALVVALNAVWLQLLVAAATWGILSLMRGGSASTRYSILAVALCACVALPFAATFAPMLLPHTQPAPPATTSVRVVHSKYPPAVGRATKLAHPSHRSISGNTATTQPSRFSLRLPPVIVRAAVIAWFAVTLMLLLRLTLSFVHLGRLKRDALPLPIDYREHLRRWERAAAGTVRLCVSDGTEVPIAIGWFDTMVLIPKRLLEILDADDLDRIVLHEIAHLRRRDVLLYALQQLGSSLFFFSPGLAWTVQQLDLEREVSCDDWVVSDAGDATPYAKCLVRLAEGTPWPHRAVAAPGVFITRRSMSIRIERILRRTGAVRIRPARLPVALTLLAMLVVGGLAMTVAPSIAYTESATVRKPAVTRQSYAHRVPARTLQTPAMPAGLAQTTLTPAMTPSPTVTTITTHVATRVTTHAAMHVATHVFTKPSLPANDVTYTPSPPQTFVAQADDDYIGRMERAMARRLSVNELISLKAMNVNPADVQAWRNEGFPDIRVDDLLSARAVGLTPQGFASLRAAYPGLRFSDAISLLSLHADAQYRANLQAAGLQDLTVSQVISLKSLGVDAHYVQEANAMGFGRLSVSQLTELKALDIDNAYVQRVRQHGFTNLSLKQLVQLKTSGVIP